MSTSRSSNNDAKVCFICGSYTKETIDIYAPRNGPNIVDLINEKYKGKRNPDDKFLCYSCNNWLVNWHTLRACPGNNTSSNSASSSHNPASTTGANADTVEFCNILTASDTESSSVRPDENTPTSRRTNAQTPIVVTPPITEMLPPPYQLMKAVSDPYFDGCTETLWLREKLKQYLYKKHHSSTSETVVQNVSISKVDAVERRRTRRLSPLSQSSQQHHHQRRFAEVSAAAVGTAAERVAADAHATVPFPSVSSDATGLKHKMVDCESKRQKIMEKPYRKPIAILNPRTKRSQERVKLYNAQRRYSGARANGQRRTRPPAQSAVTECGQCGRVLHIFVNHVRTGAHFVLSQRVQRLCIECRRCLHRINFGNSREAFLARAQLANNDAILEMRKHQASRIVFDRLMADNVAGLSDNVLVLHFNTLAGKSVRNLHIAQPEFTASTDAQATGYCSQLAAHLGKLGTTLEREDANNVEHLADSSTSTTAIENMVAVAARKPQKSLIMSPDGETRVTSTTSPTIPPPHKMLSVPLLSTKQQLATKSSASLAELQKTAPVLFARLSLPRSSSIAAHHNERIMQFYRRPPKLESKLLTHLRKNRRLQSKEAIMFNDFVIDVKPDDHNDANDESESVVVQQRRLCIDDKMQYDTGHNAGATAVTDNDGYKRNDRNEIVLAFDRTLTEVLPVAEQRRIARKVAADAAVLSVDDDGHDGAGGNTIATTTNDLKHDKQKYKDEFNEFECQKSAINDDRMVAARATANGKVIDPIYEKLPKSLSIMLLMQED